MSYAVWCKHLQQKEKAAVTLHHPLACLPARPCRCHHLTLKCYLTHEQSAYNCLYIEQELFWGWTFLLYQFTPWPQSWDVLNRLRACGVVAAWENRQVVNDGKMHLVCRTKANLSFRFNYKRLACRTGLTSSHPLKKPNMDCYKSH